MTTMRDVGDRAGVSAKTVSRVLRNDRYVREEVRERVLAAVQEMAYVPNGLAVSFRSGRDAVVGIAVPDIADPFFAQVIQSVETFARERGTAVIVASLGYDPDYEQEVVRAMLQRQLLGLISCPVADDQSYLEPWRSRTPMVFVDRAPSRLRADSVTEDDLGGAEAATSHLLQHGHTRIAFIGDALSTSLQRLAGYRQALDAAGLPDDEALVHLGDSNTGALDAVLDAWSRLEEPPTAVFSSNARFSIALVPVIRARRSTLAMVSFGDFPMAASLDPAVTVVDQNPAAVGSFAAERLFARIDDPGRRLRRHTVLPVELIERQSGVLATRRRRS